MRKETSESVSSVNETEKVSSTQEVFDYYTEANRPAREKEKKAREEKQQLEKEAMEARGADERRMQEIRESIRKEDRTVPPYKREDWAYMPGGEMQAPGGEESKKAEEAVEGKEQIEEVKEEETGKIEVSENKEEAGQAETEIANPKESEGSEAEKMIPADKTDEKAEKIVEKYPLTDPEKIPEEEPKLSDLDKKPDYEIKKAVKEKVTPITGEPVGEKEEKKEASKTEKAETESEKENPDEKKPETEKTKRAARERMNIPESQSSKVAAKYGREIDALMKAFHGGKADEEAQKIIEKYSLDESDPASWYGRAMELGALQMAASSLAGLSDSEFITRETVKSGDLAQIFLAAEIAAKKVEAMVISQDMLGKMADVSPEQEKSLDSLIMGYSREYDRQKEADKKQPENGTVTHKLIPYQESKLWNAVISNDDKNNKQALDILLSRTGRGNQFEAITHAEGFHMNSTMANGKLYFDIKWKDENGKQNELQYMLDGTALGHKAYRPGFMKNIKFWKKYPTVFEIVEKKAEKANIVQSQRAESAAPEETEFTKKYPKAAAFIADFRKVYRDYTEDLAYAKQLEDNLLGKKETEARTMLEDFIAGAEEGIKDPKLGKEAKEDQEYLIKLAKNALSELPKKTNEKTKGERKKADEGEEKKTERYPKVFVMKDLEPGDSVVVKKNINGVKREFQYKMEGDGIVYLSKEGNNGELTQSIVGSKFRVEKGIDGVVDIEVIRMKEEKKDRKKEPEDKKEKLGVEVQKLNGNQIMEGDVYKIVAEGEKYKIYNHNSQLYLVRPDDTLVSVDEEFTIEKDKKAKMLLLGGDKDGSDIYFEKKIDRISVKSRSDMR